ncbi:unnamed protein product [Didymodactylos carnosus]|uniref:Uncharacterized protein n=1 Tax=Didymodactylos carnosus TaxID=1234261 RepID=A0A815PHH8_9BILA|nr:unnamed protein product [Didymodactylos carnosus]CAF1448823.1 unnamed protein product [Didymodactylos carnosus]CAF3804950.1 unnamed protein product [Didymodactylos carnosus]CAF4322788.1 unnamed protein product [Didymodactylos carnosus]
MTTIKVEMVNNTNDDSLTTNQTKSFIVTKILDNLLKGYDRQIRPNFGEGPIEILFDILVNSFGPISDIDMVSDKK